MKPKLRLPFLNSLKKSLECAGGWRRSARHGFRAPQAHLSVWRWRALEAWRAERLHPPRIFRQGCAAFLALCFALTPAHALSPTEWRNQQTLDVPAPGLVRAALPPATLNAARFGLEDVRLLDSAGQEVPFLIEQPAPEPAARRRPKAFRVSLEPPTTTLLLETGMTQPIGVAVLESPARDFIKAARVEGSHDGKKWQPLAAGLPVFRRPEGAARLHVEFPPGVWEFLRVTLDDRRSEAVPFTGAELLGEKSGTPSVPVSASIKSRDESPGVTRLAVDLGAANLRLVSITFETSEPLFTRAVTIAVPTVFEDGIRELTIADGAVHRESIGDITAAQLTVGIERTVASRELLVLIRNQDSPPLAVSAVRAERRPVHLVFLVRAPGAFRLLTGHGQCPAPNYDIAALAGRLKGAAATEITASALFANPSYRAPETLPGLAESAASLDIAPWKYRKPVQLAQAGVQQLELDLDVLSRTRAPFADLRLIRDERQIPYLIEQTSLTRALAPQVTPANDPKAPRSSRWSLKLPQTALPVTRLALASATPLFSRELRLWEEVTDSRGDKYPRELGCAIRQRRPGAPAVDIVLDITQPPLTDTLFLTTENGDNPPIDISNVRIFYPATRLVFKAAPDAAKPLQLCYGNSGAAPPSYDLRLVAGELLAAERSTAVLGVEAGGKKSTFIENASLSGARRFVFWGILAAVVIGLLVILARLLPSPKPPS